jgi:hypothetical protein
VPQELGRSRQADSDFADMIFDDPRGAQDLVRDYIEETRPPLPRLDKRASDRELAKIAEDTALRAETKLRLREGDLVDPLIPPFTVGKEDFDRFVDSEMPAIIFTRETETPAAVTVPYALQPPTIWATGFKYMCTIRRRTTANLTKKQMELLTWETDLRAFLVDGMLNELAATKNSKFIGFIRQFLVGPDETAVYSGAVQWKTIQGSLSRRSLVEFAKILRRTWSRLPVKKTLTNDITMLDFANMDLIEYGNTSGAADLLMNGVGEVKTVLGFDIMTTIQHDLVQENEMFGFAGPEFMGKHISFRTPTVHLEVKNENVTVYADAYDGMTIANTNSFCITRFEGENV